MGDFITSSDAERLNLIIRWQDDDSVQQVAAQLPWCHNCVLLDKLKTNEERAWYSQLTIQNGWSRNVLVHQIESDLFHRQGRTSTNACP
jgi:predicted nuclease of restriction endonuclease-like (RecB) superfamily